MIHKNAAPTGVWQNNKALNISEDKAEKPESSIHVAPKPKKEKPKKVEPVLEEAPQEEPESVVQDAVEEEPPVKTESETDSL
jgi:hypothetical protein